MNECVRFLNLGGGTIMELELQVNKPKKSIKTISFTTFAVIFILGGFFFLESLTEGLLPWITIGCPGCDANNPNYNVDLFRWFGAIHGAHVGILMTGSLIALLWKPWNKVLLLQFYILAHIIFVAVFYIFPSEPNPDALPFIEIIFFIPSIILALLYPGKGLWSNMFKGANSHRPLLILTFISALVMAPIAWQHFNFQLNNNDQFTEFNRWNSTVSLYIAFIFTSLLASTRKPGWKELTILIGIAYLYLGVAAFTVPDLPGSWGIIGGILSTIGGVAYLFFAFSKKINQNV